MANIPEPAVRFGVVVAAAILWVAKGYALSVYRGEKEFKVVMALKTLVIGVVGGVIALALGNGTGGEAIAMAVAFAVPFVDNVWNQFSSTWRGLEELDAVERFERAANDLLDEYGDDAAAKMDETRKRLTDQHSTGGSLGRLGNAMGSMGEVAAGPAGQTGTPASHGAAQQTETLPEGEPPADDDTPVAVRVHERIDSVPDGRAGWLTLRAVAAHIPAVDGNDDRAGIETALRQQPPETVLDAFDAVEAEARGKRSKGGGGAL